MDSLDFILETEVLPPALLRTRWVKVTDFPKSKKHSKHLMVLDRCWTRVDARDELQKKNEKAVRLVLRLIGYFIETESKIKKVFKRKPSLSLISPVYHRVVRNFHRVVQNKNTLIPHSIKVGLVKDHKMLKKLEELKHVPKSVKALYRKEVRLSYNRSLNVTPYLLAFEKATEDWANYRRNYLISYSKGNRA